MLELSAVEGTMTTTSHETRSCLDDRDLARLGFWSLAGYAPAFFAAVEQTLGEVWRVGSATQLTTGDQRRLASVSEAASLALRASDSTWRERLIAQGDRELRALRDGRWVLPSDHLALTSALAALEHAPPFLFGWGDAAAVTACPARGIAMVGSRRCDQRWFSLAFEFAARAAELGMTVVSGGAIGVDTAVHRGALDRGCPTVVMLPTALTRPYPRANRGLFEEIAAGGGAVLSPFAAGHAPRKHHFVLRNSFIAAAARVTVVVRAGQESGSLRTAEAASRMGRPVATIPGDIRDPDAAGCNQLLRRGAWALTDVTDMQAILERSGPCSEGPVALFPAPREKTARTALAMAHIERNARPPAEQTRPLPPGTAGRILTSLRDKPKHVDELSRALNESPAKLAGPLLELELGSLVERTDGGRYRAATGRSS